MAQLNNDIKVALDIISRIDERVKAIQVNHKDLDNDVDILFSKINNLSSRVLVLESRNVQVKDLEDKISDLKCQIGKINSVGTDAHIKYEQALKEKLERLDHIDRYIEFQQQGWMIKVKHYGPIILQAVLTILAALILYRFGIGT